MFLCSKFTTLLSLINFYVLCCDIKVVFHMSIHSSNLCSEKEPGVCMHVWHGKDRERVEIINTVRWKSNLNFVFVTCICTCIYAYTCNWLPYYRNLASPIPRLLPINLFLTCQLKSKNGRYTNSH